MAGMRQRRSRSRRGPASARSRGSPRLGQRPGPGEVALVGGERPPEAVGAARSRPVGQAARRGPPSAWPAGRRARAPSPGRRRAPKRRIQSSTQACASARGGAVAERGEVVEPEAGLPLAPRAAGRGAARAQIAPPRGRDLVAERPPAAGEQRLPALGVAEQDRLGQRSRRPRARPPSRARCAQSRLRQARGARASRSRRAFSVRADCDIRGPPECFVHSSISPGAPSPCHAAQSRRDLLRLLEGRRRRSRPCRRAPASSRGGGGGRRRRRSSRDRGRAPPGRGDRAAPRGARRRKRASCASPSAGRSEQTQ